MAIVGIALMEVLSDANGVALMTIAVSILVPLYNVLAVIALELCSGRKVSIGTALRNVLKNPLIIGAVSGILVRFIGLRLPSAVESAVASLGKAGMTMALLTLGASFDFSEVGKNLRRLLFGNIMRLIIVPLITVGCAVFFGFRGDELAVILLCGATPVATTAFSMAQVYNSDYELTGQLVVTTSLMSCPTLFVWIFALKQLHLI
ncbi:MAG: AEC family transporter [Oscillospiraceae bacterium]